MTPVERAYSEASLAHVQAVERVRYASLLVDVADARQLEASNDETHRDYLSALRALDRARGREVQARREREQAFSALISQAQDVARARRAEES